MNQVILIGRLTRDPSIYGENEKKVAKFTLAVDRSVAKEDAKADFINIVAFTKKADFTEQYLKKGPKIALIGRIQTGSYVKDGEKVYTYDVIAEHIEFAESKKTGEITGASDTDGDQDFMNVPSDQKDEMPF